MAIKKKKFKKSKVIRNAFAIVALAKKSSPMKDRRDRRRNRKSWKKDIKNED